MLLAARPDHGLELSEEGRSLHPRLLLKPSHPPFSIPRTTKMWRSSCVTLQSCYKSETPSKDRFISDESRKHETNVRREKIRQIAFKFEIRSCASRHTRKTKVFNFLQRARANNAQGNKGKSIRKKPKRAGEDAIR